MNTTDLPARRAGENAVPRRRLLQQALTVLFAVSLACASLGTCKAQSRAPEDLVKGFVHPPDSARPWVYWFWLNGNITSNGITADLEAMKRVGVGGVLIMEVDQGAPVGPIGFMSDSWRALFKHVVSEAGRLGLEVNMNNDAGWNGSGGPWIKPEQSMQKVVFSETNIQGPIQFEGLLAQPETIAGYYRDISVMAFPVPGSYRIDNIKVRGAYEIGEVGFLPPTNLPPEMVVDQARIVDLTAKMDKTGRLVWDVPPGAWRVLRAGHTSTGAENAPSPASGRGLECDKLSKEGIEAQFSGMMGKLIADVGPGAGRTLVTTHIDSWENGSQNWTPRMREEFQKRRAYDLMPFLPVLSGVVVGSLERSERFLWDLRQTVSDLVVENYADHLKTLAKPYGVKLSIEAYGSPTDNQPYAGRADEPMGEFWIGGGALTTCKEMASAGHTYGKRIVGAESFTAGDQERWLDHPASIKALGDQALSVGINRFVFHRYPLQPWEDRRPGMTMGPWGTHFERTQTWWEWTKPWHEYLARCQFLLRQGLFVADLCYLQPEGSPVSFRSHDPKGYDYDVCGTEVLLDRMAVKDGRLVLPDGMSYRALVLQDTEIMSPKLARKLKDLVAAGATVVGPRPRRSPSLTDYPRCDEEVSQIGREVWDNCDGGAVKEHAFGKGRVVWGMPVEQVLSASGVGRDFFSRSKLNYIHRASGDTDFYFVANPHPYEVKASVTFRAKGKTPELWWPDTGRIEQATVYEEKADGLQLLLPLGPSGSVFVVFRKGGEPLDSIASVAHDGKKILPAPNRRSTIVVEKASYGVLEDPQRTRDARAAVQAIIDVGDESFQVSRLAEGNDPAAGATKALHLEYRVGGELVTLAGRDSDVIQLPDFAPQLIIQKAVYGVLDDPKRTRDVLARVQHLVETGTYSFQVARMAEGDDPAFLVVKTLIIDYTLNGKQLTAKGVDPEVIHLARPADPEQVREAWVWPEAKGQLGLEAWQAGQYELKTASGQTRSVSVPALPAVAEVEGPWEVSFAPGWGAPERATFEKLNSWSENGNQGIKYFSGTAVYQKTMTIPVAMLGKGRRLSLDLGKVRVMASVKVNGKDLGILWKPPFVVDITDCAKAGENSLEVKVVNLWINRMIGDEQLPEDSERNPDGTLKKWPEWVDSKKPSPTGRFTFTTWRLWKKDGALQESGLLGPVRLVPSIVVPLDRE